MNRTYFKEIDGTRFIAVLSVFISHWLAYIPSIERFHLGAIGVEYFFVVSGFLISLQLFNLKNEVALQRATHTKALKIFYIRRILRIFPLYYVVLFAVTLFNKGEIRDAFVWNVSYASNFYFIHVKHWTALFSHFWSLSVEEHFYLFWPLLVLWVNSKRLPGVMIVLALFSLGFRFYQFTYADNFFSTYIHTFACFDLFMFGAALAYGFTYQHDKFMRFFAAQSRLIIVLPAMVLLYTILVLYPHAGNYIWVWFRFLMGICFAFFIGFIAFPKGKLVRFIFGNKLFVHLGKISYGMYLTHSMVPGLLLGIQVLKLPIAVNFMVYLFATILLSEILHFVIEKPVNRLKAKFQLA